MAEYIERDNMTEQEKKIRHEKVNELAKIISFNPKFCKSIGDCYECPIFKKNTCEYVASAQELYDLDYRKVEQGEWEPIIQELNYCDTLECSVCEFVIDISQGDYKYCPNCGAKMKGK